jgi:hypothetical protein
MGRTAWRCLCLRTDHEGACRMRLLVCVMSCKKNQSIWNDILKRQPKDTIIFVGGGHGKPILMRNLLVLPCGDTYDRLPEKMIHLLAAIRSLPEFSDVTHILKHDDIDTYCSPENYVEIQDMLVREGGDYIGQFLTSMKENQVSGYHVRKVHKESPWSRKPFVNKTYTPYCTGGQTYILSRAAMDAVLAQWNLSNTAQLFDTEIFEDVMMGRVLTAAGMPPVERRYNVQCSHGGSSSIPMYPDMPFTFLVPRSNAESAPG